MWSFSFNAYAGVGGGITFGKNNKTGEWFGGGRLGFGLGGGAGLDLTDNGPTDRDLNQNPYGGEECTPTTAGSSGTSIGTFAGFGVSAKGGKHFDGSGGSYSDGPKVGPGFNPFGGAGFSIGGAAGVEVIGW